MRQLTGRKLGGWLILSGIALSTCMPAQTPAPSAIQLTTEFRSDPVGIGTRKPMFAWKLTAPSTTARNVRQTAYRLRLATAPAQLAAHPLWDSGRVATPLYWQQPYAGPPLQPHTTYVWQVQLWTGDASPGPWSSLAHFTTALFSPSDWTARWIAAEPDRPATPQTTGDRMDKQPSDPPPLPIFRHEFPIDKPVANALLSVAGLGQYEVRLNGKNVTDTVLNAGWTDYRKTVAYNTYDVTGLLRPRVNAFGVLLGNGMYNVEGVKGHYTKFVGSFGQPKCILQLDLRYTDGTTARIVSDGSWRTHSGPIVYSSTFGGETFDARALPPDWDQPGFAATGWTPALQVAGPGGKLAAEVSSPMAVDRTYPTIHISHPKPGTTVYDLGQNMSGWPRIEVTGPAGSSVRLLPGELLNPDGTVSQRSANAFPNDPVLFTYILRGDGRESWHPRFAYYSFRYVQVTAEPGPGNSATSPSIVSLAGDFVHARAPVTGTFSSSNPLFGRIHTLIDRAVLSNLASVVTDCPSREKLGWLEQTYLNAGTLMWNYNVTGLYEKMSDDIRDAQLANGLVPSIAPEYVAFVDKDGSSNAFRDSPEWGSAIILSPWALYQFTGDLRPLANNYPAMQRYAAFLKSRSTDGLLHHGLGDWYDIGPKDPGPSQLTAREVTATGVFYEDLVTLAHIAGILGHPEDAAAYTQQAAAVRVAFNAKLFHSDTGQYDRGSQTANAIPLALGLVPADQVQTVLNHLVADIHAHQEHVTAGDVGFHYVVRALTDYGRSDVLAAMLSRTDSPSYGYQLARGATTLTEAWDANPESSQNHFMLGHGEEWFYRGLAGLSIDMARGPEDAIHLRPSFLDGVTQAAASYDSSPGLIRINWSRSPQGARVEVLVPAGAQASLILPPGAAWSEGSLPAKSAKGVLHAEADANGLTLSLGSGTYHFSAPVLEPPSPTTSR